MIKFPYTSAKFYFLISFFSVICVSLVGSSVLTNTAFGQTISKASPSIASQQPALPKLHLVKITSPTKGEQVQVGKDLSISGTSADNGTSGCKVSVKVNFIDPYHDALPIAEGAQNNSYSKWNFTLTPAYTSIHPGQNKIIAKFSCADNPNLISKTTVNVTGVGTIPVEATANASKENSQQQISSIAAEPPQPTPNTATPVASNSANNSTATTADAISTGTTTPTAVGNEKTDPKTLSASIHFGKNSIHPGDTQTILVKVSDKDSANTISGASITGEITDPSSVTLKKLKGTTDDKGIDTYSWKTSSDYTSGKYELKVDVSYQGYSQYSTSKTFKVVPLSVTSTSTSSYKVIPYYSSNIISSYPYSTDTNYYHHSKIISSYPFSTDTNTNTYTDTNTNTYTATNHHDTDINAGSYYHHYNSYTDISSGHRTGIGKEGLALNSGMGNLAHKIINDVKSKLHSNWIQFP